MVCSSQTSVATLLLQWCLPTAVTVCWCCTQCQNTQILLLTGGLFLYWSNTPRSHGSNRTAWLQRKARGFKISFNRAKLSYNHNVSKYNTLTKVKQIPDRIEKNIIPQFHDWTTEHSLFFTLTQQKVTLTHWVWAGSPEYRQMCCMHFGFHGILAKFPCFACHENITGNQGCHMKAPSQHLDSFLQ